LFENVNWTLVFAAIAAIAGSIAAAIQVYSKVYVPRSKEKEIKRETFYKQLLDDVDALIESVQKRQEFHELFNWRTVERKVSPRLFERLTDLFEVKAKHWYNLLEHNREFIRLKCYFYLDKNLESLETEFKSLGVGALEFELFQAIATPILEGEKISFRWLDDNKPDLFENLKKCPSYKKIKALLDWLNKESPCYVFYKNAEKDLMQSVNEMKLELKRF